MLIRRVAMRTEVDREQFAMRVVRCSTCDAVLYTYNVMRFPNGRPYARTCENGHENPVQSPQRPDSEEDKRVNG